MVSLESGAETIVEQCLNIREDESVLVLNDGTDPDLINALTGYLDRKGYSFTLREYQEPANHGEEPPEKVAEAMKLSDVFIAPTKKSISHTRARVKACENGSRGATLPGIDREVWNTSLQADYSRVKEISEKVYSLMQEASEVRVETPSGTDFRFEMDIEHFHTDTGIIHEEGGFGNLPAGESDGGVVGGEGVIVVDHMPFVSNENSGGKLFVEDSRVVDWEGFPEGSEIVNALEEVEGVRNVAEFGFGTNPEAEIIGNVLQDEKVLGTVHVAIGDNTSYFPEGHGRYVESDIHWDNVMLNPTVYFDDRMVLDEGEPVFLD